MKPIVEKKHPCPKCNRKFASSEAVTQHSKDAHGEGARRSRKQRMPFREAMELVDDDLPDGAYWAMCHEMAGLEYGDGFAELGEDS